MAYKFDEDLEFMRSLESKDLNDLVEILTIDKDGELRFTETLTIDSLYKRFYPDHKEYLDLILNELQCFGGNTFLNLFRERGGLYREILCDVCSKMKVNFNRKSRIELIEQYLLMKILEDSINKMKPEDLEVLVKDLKINTTDFTPKAVAIALQLGIKKSGFLAYKIAVIVANSVSRALLGRGLTLAGNNLVTKSLSILVGPIGWVITGVWTAIDLAGPAYRVTIPAVIHVAYLRLYAQNKLDNNDTSISDEQSDENEEI